MAHLFLLVQHLLPVTEKLHEKIGTRHCFVVDAQNDFRFYALNVADRTGLDKNQPETVAAEGSDQRVGCVPMEFCGNF